MTDKCECNKQPTVAHLLHSLSSPRHMQALRGSTPSCSGRLTDLRPAPVRPTLLSVRHRRRVKAAADASTGGVNIVEKAVNSFSVLVTNSPLNEGKKRFFRILAGQYNIDATQSKINTLVAEHPASTNLLNACCLARLWLTQLPFTRSQLRPVRRVDLQRTPACPTSKD